MALTIMPCHDSEDFQLDNKGLASINQNTTDGHYENGTETCSPFCTCSCCGQSVTTPFYPTSCIGIFATVIEEFPVHTSAFFSEIYSSIWQPPKIS